ncbi:alpha/beta fold hydrolase [Parachitinimonas caeni]|uniref:Alpha/beta hydrolase n=1 Tax=Parachitinimonas caeni TaxID=3031301 RepID=A0ABT7DZN5_9NEIS|nr:alpha/beta hydrolase [Parachitinimonas caeni]MDK2125524.1 alpha/beta hydrolase [Parachitinimonas caeni]
MNNSEIYQPILAPRSHKVEIRGLVYHYLSWGAIDAPPLLLLHGWMDCASSFQFLVDRMAVNYHFIAPDWRGFGKTDWSGGSYYFPDYLADLDALIEHFAGADGRVSLVGHSMGGMIACLYSGIRPGRINKLVSIEGFGLPQTQPEQAPDRYRRWLDECANPIPTKSFRTLGEVAARLIKSNSRLTIDKANYLAPAMAVEAADGFRYRADPRHRWVNPVLYRLEEAKACWKNISAPALWVEGGDSGIQKWLKEDNAQFAARTECIRSLKIVSIPDAGHNIHHDQPAGLAAEIARFLHSSHE